MNVKNNIVDIKGIGEKTGVYFNKLNIYTVNDLIHYYPRSYDVYEKATSLKDAASNERVAIIATVKSAPKLLKVRGLVIVSFVICDEFGSIEVKYFNAPYMTKAVKAGDKKVFRGFLKNFKGRVFLNQPKIYDLEYYKSLEGTIIPIYPLTKGLSNERVTKAVYSAVNGINFVDYLCIEDLKKFNLISLDEALKNIHFPKNKEIQFYSRRRIVFEEFLDFLMLSLNKEENTKIKNSFSLIETASLNRLAEALPYKLTNAQIRVINEITDDMTGEYLMNRLVQGDVGSGKTIVSVMALLLNADNGYQGALMAPTEVLARQHFKFVSDLSLKYNLSLKPVLLTGKMSKSEKTKALKEISDGSCNVIIGTHALIQESVNYNNLTLVITDEQHRFGVKQREALRDKGINPHILVMSATPIPRTLAMILYGGISVSVIDELPKNRVPIANCVVGEKFREKAYEKIKQEIGLGHQAYVICPMVEEAEEDILMLKNVKDHAAELKEYFGEEVSVACLHGKMKPDEKTKIMEDFKDKKYDILVSTTVIEVGIDVPNATVIMIENAERFGLSQLHQLRGRVGRGDSPSFCIIMTQSKEENTLKRLKILNDTNDGFLISKKDIELRGPGELNGVRQSGELSFGLADIVDDQDILLMVSENLPYLSSIKPHEDNNLIDFRSI